MVEDPNRRPTRDDILNVIRNRSNWGRWGSDDQIGALNLITPEKRAKACASVATGRVVSMSRTFPKDPAPNNPHPAQHFMSVRQRPPNGHLATDFYGIGYHGPASTHVDALCHVWDDHGMWNGKDPADGMDYSGAKWGGVQHWINGIVTRGIFFNIPKYRGTSCVDLDHPVQGFELEAIAKQQGIVMEPGDAIVLYSGRANWDRERGKPWGSEFTRRPGSQHEVGLRPGVHASCLAFFRDHDASVLIWDMLDATPNEYDLPFPVHAAILSFGMALIDNALLEPLAQACVEESRVTFLVTCAPLPVEGGTGSPINPLAIF